MIVSPHILDRKVTRDFFLREWACHCRCGLAHPHPALAMGAQRLRELLAVAVTIGSPCRCREHNARPRTEVNERGIRGAGVAANSFHLPRADMAGYCCAADLQSAVSLRDMYRWADHIGDFHHGGISPYVSGSVSWLHVDVRGITGLHHLWRQGFIDGRAVSVEAALAEDERRRALRTKERGT